MRWTSTEPDTQGRQIGLGDFDHAIFEHLPYIAETGFNAIELLPVQDSKDTVNWGYGTRFFFAPDYDMGTPVDLKAFIKKCHQQGIRVLLDVVMNHAKDCPLQKLAMEWYFLESPSEEERDADWGGKCFRLQQPRPDDRYLAREFLFGMARYWVREYHMDGFRIDEAKGINNYDFLQEFTEAAWDEHNKVFPDRPFIVIAEDSARRAAMTQPTHRGRKVVNAIWDFNYRDEARRAISDRMFTNWGEPSRRQRVEAFISGSESWNDWNHRFEGGFGDMGQHIIYQTSHDVEKPGEQRLINYLLCEELSVRGWTDIGYQNIRNVVDGYPGYTEADAIDALNVAFERARSAYGLLMCSVGIPMYLAGEQYADTHDLDHTQWRQKMSDVLNSDRRGRPRHLQLETQVAELIELRKNHSALLRNEIDFFYFHPTFDDNGGERVFAFCRTAGKPLYSTGQVVVVANLSRRSYPSFIFNDWHWEHCSEHAMSTQGSSAFFSWQHANIPLLPGQVRVFTT
ncbi:MAG: hypothetical protein JW863_17470 [Chitinispirillaceae bacterium]|nr:hypothetical protein [Chitinispirillaceae bacterium]